jgi:hydrogenase/urease accessory protein HupE
MRLGFIGLLFVFLLTGPLAVSAHEGRPVYVEVTQQSADMYQVRWKIPPVLEPDTLPMIRLAGADCTLSAGAPRPSLTGTQIYKCAGGPSALRVDLRYPGANPVLSSLVLVRTLDGFEQSTMAGPDTLSIPLPVAETFWQVAGRYTSTGMQHILEGYDHLLFVLCLMLLSGTMRRIMITVTGFTLGHSVTLAISALAGWSLSPAFVEPLIAFSILILAVEITKGKHTTLAYRYPAIVATGFGLLHGFGFGGALAEIGLPYGLKIQALAFFNVGVEVGQLLFVITAYLLYYLAGKSERALSGRVNTAALKPFVVIPTGIIAAYWTIDRLAIIWQ